MHKIEARVNSHAGNQMKNFKNWAHTKNPTILHNTETTYYQMLGGRKSHDET